MACLGHACSIDRFVGKITRVFQQGAQKESTLTHLLR